ncbi:MAG TPA: CPBP family intramembrane glutamic endopeptidase [Candidatus Acidoferrum sp.]|nr:CPBP family intramembrane glutamic endopeptidase [Candidatus Acidoferrum sp.]
MTVFDDKPPSLPEQDPPEQESLLPAAAEPLSVEDPNSPLAGDPINYAAGAPSPYTPRPALPEDLRISWSWTHFFVFVFFAVSSFFLVQMVLILYFAPHRTMSPKELERYLLSKPQFLFGTNILWYAMIFLFLYVTLGVLPGKPFWRTLGWKKLQSNLSAGKANPWAYFLAGCGLAIFVFLASSQVHTNDKMPIQEVLKNRSSAMLLMAMAVLVAPLVEETVFRGYLYPLFAKSFGIVPGILLTGVLFGLMHGSQLGWTWGIVGLLILVGIIFTFARAHTGTVLASFLLHLGYNSMIAIATIIGTHGFTKIPTP